MATVQGLPADAPRVSASVGSPVSAAPPPPGSAVGAGSLSPSHNKNSRTARASTPGVATPGPLDPEAESDEEEDDAKTDPELPSDTDPASNADPTLDVDNTSADPIDMETLLQILDLDEEDNHDFSRGMAWAYFEQAAETFGDMDKAFEQSSLPTLSSLGHFLKGSSAALGVYKVQRSCEQIQHYGELRDEDRGVDLEEDEALGRIREVLTRVKREYAEAEKWLKEYYAKLDGEA